MLGGRRRDDRNGGAEAPHSMGLAARAAYLLLTRDVLAGFGYAEDE